MFHTTLLDEYENARRMGMTERELTRLIQAGFEHAFDPFLPVQIVQHEVGDSNEESYPNPKLC